uniref:Uncharacterized protein n=1 Tax=Parascaris equorum TaxID=6256 RepID=A0A914RFT7_PAREQ
MIVSAVLLSLKYTFSGDIRIDMELDGVKVFTPDKLVFISVVPEQQFDKAVRQSNDLKVETLIDRLIDTGMWPMAMAIAEYMKHTSKDGMHRIEYMKAQKEAGRVPDYAGVSELIVKRFSNYPEVSFA